MFLFQSACSSGFHSTAAGRRKHFAGAQSSIGIKRGAQPLHGGQVVGGKQLVHEANFFYANTMFAGHAAAAGDALFKNFAAGRKHAADLCRVALSNSRIG